ncbi:hypothetical protein K438DRAFT_325316 [Mycena galopus ATCC 62051]|nr:hypothetical protein K438DRAFT_325316 [Mycena galopus ATCC 62051]
MCYDDPANTDILAAIQAGHHLGPKRLPRPVRRRPSHAGTSADYVPPPPKPFSGSGNSLGALVPAASSTSYSTAMGSSNAAAMASGPVGFGVDQTQPTTSVQIRLADGTRIVCRMNLTHTVHDLRNFINGCALLCFRHASAHITRN